VKGVEVNYFVVTLLGRMDGMCEVGTLGERWISVLLTPSFRSYPQAGWNEKGVKMG
jgi:hypothetical protein